MEKEYGDYEMVNGAVVNDLNARIAELEAKLKNSVSLEYHDELVLSARKEIVRLEAQLADVQPHNTELVVRANAAEAKLARVHDFLGYFHEDSDLYKELSRILSDTRKPLAVDVCNIQSDGTPGWYEVTACWPAGGTIMPLIGFDATVIVMPKEVE